MFLLNSSLTSFEFPNSHSGLSNICVNSTMLTQIEVASSGSTKFAARPTATQLLTHGSS